MDDLQERINRAANRTWQAVGGDVLRSAQADSLPSEDVVECVLDFIQDYGRDEEAIAEFNKLSFEEKVEMLRQAFRFARYGL